MSPEKIPNWINELCSIFPCMIQRAQGNGFNVDWGKVAQSLVVVAIIASSTSFVTVKVLESQFSELKSDVKEDVAEIKEDIKNIILKDIEFKTDVNKQFTDIARNVIKIESQQLEFRDRLGKLEAK